MHALRCPTSRFPSLSIALALAAFSKLVQSLGPLEPNDGQAYLGAWVNTAQPFYDTPAAFNKRIGHNAYAFQFAQTIPVTPYSYVDGTGGTINETFVELSGTSAAVFLTVYPTSLDNVDDGNLTALAKQILSYQSAPLNRDVFLRFGPEMQGSWMPYGRQPTAYVALWKRMHDVVRSVAPKTVLVWAPNAAMGYPYEQNFASTSSADQGLLDTNHNGQLDRGDDAYAPYYPGDDYVDWNGISWYWKGTDYPYTVNQISPTNYSAGAMTGNSPAGAIGSTGPQSFTAFYGTYCQTKPCMFAEMGAAFHSNTTSGAGPGQLAIQTAWWQDALTSSTFMDAYPKMKLFMLFEQSKPEDASDLRDFRLTVEPTVLSSFNKDLSSVSSRYVWAQDRAISTAGTGAPSRTSTSANGWPSQTLGPNIFRNHATNTRIPVILGVLAVLNSLLVLMIT